MKKKIAMTIAYIAVSYVLAIGLGKWLYRFQFGNSLEE